MKKTCILFILQFFLICSGKLIGGGFQVNLQGQKQSGMGHCGTGYVSDASGIFFNPGTISFLNNNSITTGASLIFHRTLYRESYPGTYTAETENTIGTPFTFYAAFKTKKENKLSVGIGVYTPFGSRVKYDDSWKGNFLLREIDLKAVFIQPALSYKLSDQLGIGAGFVYATGSVTLRQGIPVENYDGVYGEGKLNGSANGLGFNAGIIFKANEKFSAGISYRSSVKMKVDNGNAVFTVPSSLEKYFPATNFSASLPLPSVTNVGIAYQRNEKLMFALDLNYVGWKSYDTLSFDFRDNTEKLTDVHSPRSYKNSSIVRLGAQYHLKEKIFVRAGVYYDFSPVQNGYLTPETPDANKLAFTFGGSYRAGKHFNIDASFIYITSQPRTDTNIETSFSGTWLSKALIPGVSVEYLF